MVSAGRRAGPGGRKTRLRPHCPAPPPIRPTSCLPLGLGSLLDRFTLPHPQGALWVWVGLEVYAEKSGLAAWWPALPLPKASWVYWEGSCWRAETASGLIDCLERKNNKNNKA